MLRPSDYTVNGAGGGHWSDDSASEAAIEIAVGEQCDSLALAHAFAFSIYPPCPSLRASVCVSNRDSSGSSQSAIGGDGNWPPKMVAM